MIRELQGRAHEAESRASRAETALAEESAKLRGETSKLRSEIEAAHRRADTAEARGERALKEAEDMNEQHVQSLNSIEKQKEQNRWCKHGSTESDAPQKYYGNQERMTQRLKCFWQTSASI